MKKLLLLSSAMLMSATVAVFAGNGGGVLPTVNTQTKVLTKASTMSGQVMKENAYAVITSHGYTATTIPVRKATEPGVSYQLPAGYFYMGASLEKGALYHNGGVLQGPAYQETTWKNTSTAGDSFKWTYGDSEGNNATAETKDLTTPEYPFMIVAAPKLTAQVNGQEVSYQEGSGPMQTGGILAFKNSPLGMDDGTYGAVRFKTTKQDEMSFGNVFHYKNAVADAFWKENGFGSINSFTVVYDVPASPYALSDAWMNVVLDEVTAATDQYTLNIRKVTIKDGNYLIGDVLASGTCKASELNKLVDTPDGPIGMLYFRFKQQEGGLVADVDLTVDHAIAVELAPNQANAGGIIPVGFFSSTQDLNSQSFVGFDSGKYFPAGGISFGSVEATSYCNNFVFTLGVTYTYLFSQDGDYNFKAANDGESKAFNMKTLYPGDAWNIDGEGVDDWIQYSYGDFNPEAGEVALTFEVSALPTGVQGRSSKVTVSMPGASQEFTITQGIATGIFNTEVAATKVVCDGENIQLTYPEEIRMVTVLNVAGQTLATYDLPVGGNYTISTVGLSQGIYILKFNNSKTVKIIK